MISACSMQSRMTPQGMQPVELKPHGTMQPTVRHRDPSPVMSVLVVMGFVGICLGVVVCSNYLDQAAKNKAREPAHNMPMVHMR